MNRSKDQLQLPVLADVKAVAVRIVDDAHSNDLPRLKNWIERLLEIRGSQTTGLEKLKATVQATFASKAIWPLIKAIAFQAKKYGWDTRSSRSRWGMTAAMVSVAAFGGQSAGIAALGGAIGVPLWVVFGAGATFAKTMLDAINDELQAKKSGAVADPSVKFGEVVDAEFIDITPGPKRDI